MEFTMKDPPETKPDFDKSRFVAVISPQDIRALREQLGESLSQFGWTLKRAIDPKASRPFSRQYVSGLENGKPEYRITEEIQTAFWVIAGNLDGVSAGLAGMTQVSVYAIPNHVKPGTVVPRSAKVVKCATPGCPVWFIRTHPRQKYHDPECGKNKGK